MKENHKNANAWKSTFNYLDMQLGKIIKHRNTNLVELTYCTYSHDRKPYILLVTLNNEMHIQEHLNKK